jgi:hypothetical protein
MINDYVHLTCESTNLSIKILSTFICFSYIGTVSNLSDVFAK